MPVETQSDQNVQPSSYGFTTHEYNLADSYSLWAFSRFHPDSHHLILWKFHI